jgi:hypothetical protein
MLMTMDLLSHAEHSVSMGNWFFALGVIGLLVLVCLLVFAAA